ncbi:sporulation integral membrane protein YtvI [Hespellia stercorisuis]|nr:sporulation integral membrane protein YtvI [Hespellia stercorisuis]
MENKRPYWQVAVSLMFSLLATAAFLFISWKLLILLMPFAIGWILAMIASPLVEWLERHFKIVKKLGSALVVILVLGLIVVMLYFAISRIASEMVSLVRNSSELYQQLEIGLRQIGDSMNGIFSKLPGGLQARWGSLLDSLDQYAGTVLNKISDPTVTAVGNMAKSVPSFLISCIVSIMSAYLFIVQRDQVIAWFKRMAPPSVAKRMGLVFDNLRYAVGGYFKAQFKIMAIVFVILIAGFSMMGVRYAVLLGLLIAFLDFLPFFGTGTAMIPWALYKLLIGNYKMAIILIIIYVITQAVHQLLQPKLISDSVGINPLVTLVLLYVGYKISSVLGMILAVPIGMVLINMVQAGAFDYILDDVNILVEGILGLREE